MGSLPEYEQIASFYLGKKFDLAGRQLHDEKVLYDAKDLTTHAMCVGMTGSGKTGLCLSLLEEAALDGVPAICIDPKGDLGNLLLAFPDFQAKDFQPWIDPSEAERKQMPLEELAAETAKTWQDGLADWDQDAERVRRFKNSVDISIYTPGSNAGIPISVLKSFDAPSQSVIDDADVFRERVAGAASGLLTLMGIEPDPLSSKEHILLASILEHSWLEGRNLDLPELIRAVQSPPLEKVGVFDLETFYPAAERSKLAMLMNNLLASPSFAGWMEGEPLNIQNLLYGHDGKPRLSILSIAHLSDHERMFFVTTLLNELLAWVRSQPGTGSLRALFYMDEVYGYFPPSAKPPSKPPMMVLLKQARAFGLGIVLATQNPVDLDYKGLSNIGTWFLGRLQTQRDKERVLDGLQGVAAQAGARFDKSAMESTLAALGNRVFLMNNVHDDGPTIFQTRWAMSYLSGPLSRPQIQRLMESRKSEPPVEQPERTDTQPAASEPKSERAILPHGVSEKFCLPNRILTGDRRLVYRPALLASASCHYVRVSAGLDDWFDRSLLYQAGEELDDDIWAHSKLVTAEQLDLADQAKEDFAFAEPPAEMLNAKQYARWEKEVRDHLYRQVPMELFECKELKTFSRPGQDDFEARLDWKQAVRELRDDEKEELQVKYSKKVASLESKIRTAQQRLERERAQYDSQKWSSMINIGQTVLGAFLGNKVSSRGATAGRSMGRTAQQHTDVVHAQETLEELAREKHELEEAGMREIRELQDKYSIENLTLEPVEFPCRKGDLRVKSLQVVWMPWEVQNDGTMQPLFEI